MLLIDFDNLYYMISQKKKLFLYGIGKIGQIVKKELEFRGRTIEYAIVSSRENGEKQFGELKIKSIDEVADELKKTEKESVIVISVDRVFNDEIITELRKRNISNYIPVIDFMVNSPQYDLMCQKMGFIHNEQIESIYGETNPKTIIMKRTGNKAKEQVLFIISMYSPRVCKITRALKRNGYKVRYLLMDDFTSNIGNNQRIVEEMGEIEVLRYDSLSELQRELISNDIAFIYIFSRITADRSLSVYAWLIKMKKDLPTIVFEEYDIGILYDHLPSINLEREKYCIENADIVIDRAFELIYALNEKGYIINGQRIQIFDSCDEDQFVLNDSFRNMHASYETSEEIHLCYAGGLIQTKNYPEFDWSKELAEMCLENKCHLHVYPSPNSWKENKEELYGIYFKLDNENEYFHLHNPVPYSELSKEISKYDYGIHPTFKDKNGRGGFGYYREGKFIYAATNHVFDYLNAGLPVVIAEPILFAKVFEEKGVGINWYIEDYDFNFLKEHRNEFHTRVIDVRNDFLIDAGVKKIIESVQSMYE